MFVSYALHVKSTSGRSVRLLTSPRNPANVYLEGMGIRHVLDAGTSTDEWDESCQNTGLHVIRSHADVIRFVRSAVQLGRGPNDQTMDALRYGMAELGRNVVQHSQSESGGVAIAQYFPDRHAIQIAMCDSGRGVFSSLKSPYPELRGDMEALKFAVLPHVSGAFRHGMYSAADNAGLGLFFSKEICWRADGTFWLVSGKSLLGVKNEDSSGKNRVYRTVNPWHGTLVAMDLPSEGVVDFSSLLQVCNDLAKHARESSGSAGLDFIDVLPELDGLSVVKVGTFQEDVEAAAAIRQKQILPAVQQGHMLVLDFQGVRFVTQSFAHALLSDALKIPGSLARLSFLNCTRPSEEAIRAVAAYSACYSQCL